MEATSNLDEGSKSMVQVVVGEVNQTDSENPLEKIDEKSGSLIENTTLVEEDVGKIEKMSSPPPANDDDPTDHSTKVRKSQKQESILFVLF